MTENATETTQTTETELAPGGATPPSPPEGVQLTAEQEDVLEAMRDVVDPELGINVVDLGLVYGVGVDAERIATIDMTLTSAACPLTDVIEDQAREALDGVVADFRMRDIAAGGQGAPLVPAFHAALFGSGAHRAIVNIGGIANVTDLPPTGGVRGFDTGPGNVFVDLWHARHRGEPFDRDGEWARTGTIDRPLLSRLLAEPYFALPPPKSTGRDLFNAGWLDAILAGRATAPADVQATLVALTATTIADAIAAHCADATEVLVCGGGARNATLMDELSRRTRPRTVESTAAHGVPVDQVEALAFAWLARETLAGRAGNLPGVTGARGPRVLGAIYPR